MRGRRVLMELFVSHGVRHIFGNPGTTETPLLDSLPAFPQLDYIMTLHEGVAVGAASFYAQASRPRHGGQPPRRARARQRHRLDLWRAEGELARRGYRGPAGHAHAAEKSPARPRPRRHGRARHQVERADRARRRDRADHAPRLQGRHRCAARPGVRVAADRRDGTGDRDRGEHAGPIVARDASESGRRRGAGRAAAESKNPAILAGDEVARVGRASRPSSR